MDEKMKIITEEYEKELQIYYNKNFVNKDLTLAILDNIKDATKYLGAAYLKFEFLFDSLKLIKQNDPSLYSQHRETIDSSLEVIKMINDELRVFVDIIFDELKKNPM